ncbi:hypothetical protein EVAR_23247_1 [Eumeta japonica]|uniref:Uncharacterized protein n=1 Tax=Eumeta variegata TaxID=151549 RepID=A0A4C1VG19_EUMVA|nr:hypothetical protein EVAR_23247_1 [Eumeta japonica]
MRLTCCEALTTSKAMDWSALTTGSNKAEYLVIKVSIMIPIPLSVLDFDSSGSDPGLDPGSIFQVLLSPP